MNFMQGQAPNQFYGNVGAHLSPGLPSHISNQGLNSMQREPLSANNVQSFNLANSLETNNNLPTSSLMSG
jgi:hypothetical protein